ncbi:MAG: DUF2807 domain-containing protein [Azoarcus sp.]|nr:DUF2807 domain-containing protein [Azoarcus sp.]
MILAGLLFMTLSEAAELAIRRHELPGVSRVVIETVGDLQVRPGAEARLTIEAEAEVLQELDISIQEDTVFLCSKGNIKTRHAVKFVTVLPRLQSLSSRGSGDATVGAFDGKQLDIELGSSGNIALDGVKAEQLTLHVAGSGHIDATGRGDTLRAEISGSGEIRAEGYVVIRAEAKIGGAGEIRLHASESLDAVIDGAGNIRYTGSPAVTQSISGAGSIGPL